MYIQSLLNGVLYIEIVYLLMKNDAVVKCKNSDGWIALDEAVSYGNREMSKTYTSYLQE